MVSLVTNVYALFSLWDRKIMQFTDKIVTPQKDDLTLMDPVHLSHIKRLFTSYYSGIILPTDDHTPKTLRGTLLFCMCMVTISTVLQLPKYNAHGS